jgi:hypothetical protein
MSSPEIPKNKKAARPAEDSPVPPVELASENSPPDNLRATLEDLGAKAGDYLKGLASWRLVETKSDAAAGEPDPILVSLKKITSWGLNEEKGGAPAPLGPVGEDPLAKPVREAGAYLRDLELFKPGEAAAEYRDQAAADLNKLGSVLKDAASWRGATLTGLFSWRVVEGDAEQPRDASDTIRGSLQGFVDLGHQAADFLKGLASGRPAEAAADEAASEPGPLAASLKDIATWRFSLKNLATWRFGAEAAALPEAAETEAAPLEESLGKPFADLAQQTGDYLKGLATWRMTEGGGEAAREPAEPDTKAPAAPAEEPYKFDVLASALTRNDVRRP